MISSPRKGLVSVIIPTYNRASYVLQAIENALAQDYPDIEIIVVDDASTDNTEEAVLVFGDRVKYIKKVVNQGLSAARNTGLAVARGEFINFLDDDDLMSFDKISQQVKWLEENPGDGVVYCRYIYIDQDGNYIDECDELPIGHIYNELAKECVLVPLSALVRKKCIDDVGLFDANLPWEGQLLEDWDFWLRLSKIGVSFGCIQKTLVKYRIHMHGMFQSAPKKVMTSTLGIYKKVFDDPEVPEELLRKKPMFFRDFHLYIGGLCYANQLWGEGKDQLTSALEIYPQFREDPEEFLFALVNRAFDPRISNPVEFIQSLFSRLPETAVFLAGYREKAVAAVKYRMALRAFRMGDQSKGRRCLAEAFSTDSAYIDDVDLIKQHMELEARFIAVTDPEQYLRSVMDNLPENAQSLKKIKRDVLGNVYMSRAFRHYSFRQIEKAFHESIWGVWYRPMWLANRGVIAMLGKSSPVWRYFSRNKGMKKGR